MRRANDLLQTQADLRVLASSATGKEIVLAESSMVGHSAGRTTSSPIGRAACISPIWDPANPAGRLVAAVYYVPQAVPDTVGDDISRPTACS